MDEHYQAGLEGLEYAAERGLGVVIMEPLRGGSFLSNIPDDVNAIWKSSGKVKTPADTALRFIWENQGVSTILSGMTRMDQLVENIKSAERSDAGGLSKDEKRIIIEVRGEYQSRIIAPCTNCRYCMPCPSGVDIPANLVYLNNTSMYNTIAPFKNSYVNFFSESKKADKCIECGQCEDACPQHIPIMDCLKQLDSIMK
jgi:predicted aldo/keto reductase-like oxidoreductase